ncbi:hypothetical protein ACFLWI_04435 [Chloroflexota bacterium]
MVNNGLFATLFVALAGISISTVALVSVILRYSGKESEEENSQKASKLSELPPFKQCVGRLYLSFASSLVGLLFSLIFSGVNSLWGNHWVITTINLILLLLPLVISLAFMYTGAGELLRSILDVKGSLIKEGAPEKFKPVLQLIGNIIAKFGNYIARGFFK